MFDGGQGRDSPELSDVDDGPPRALARREVKVAGSDNEDSVVRDAGGRLLEAKVFTRELGFLVSEFRVNDDNPSVLTKIDSIKKFNEQ